MQACAQSAGPLHPMNPELNKNYMSRLARVLRGAQISQCFKELASVTSAFLGRHDRACWWAAK